MMRLLFLLSLIACGHLAAAADNAHGAANGAAADKPTEGPAPEVQPVKTVVAKVNNPVALDIAEDGSVFVVETVRYLGKGDIDNRGKQRREYLDQSIHTLADREAVIRQLHKEGDIKTGDKSLEQFFTEYKENVWKFTDRDADGQFEKQLFYSGFNGFHSGIVAGVVARNGKVHIAAEPELWVFDDNNGTAANGKVLATGLAVKIGWYGHDLHGLVYGNDGRLYFSLADKGWHVTTPDGRILAHNNTGGVFRCWPDGSELEEFAVGLRNPQELAFDAYGNLFSGDNNCDAGDKARLVFITEGSDHGWRFSHQSLRSRGPWLREKMWELRQGKDEYLQPAWIVPPIAHIGSGPSGFTFYPGIGMPDRYDNHFLLCDFRGGRGNLDSFAVETRGAGFSMVDFHHVISGPANSSVRVGYDGKLYVADWGGGWALNDRGNVFTLHYPELVDSQAAKSLAQLSKSDFSAKSAAELAKLLAHTDARIRQRAHYALATRGDAGLPTLIAAADKGPLLARLHGVWGIGMIGRHTPSANVALLKYLADNDPEVRAQAAKTLGDRRFAAAGPALLKLATDANLRARAFALKALGKLQIAEALPAIVTALRANDNADPFLRDAAVFALHRLGPKAELPKLARDPHAAVRLGAVLAMRRANAPELAASLADAAPIVAVEAARAIYDQRITAALPALAATLDRELPEALRTEPFLRRAVQTNLYLGNAAAATRLVAFAANPVYPAEHREAAIDALLTWDAPPKREGVWGSWWQVERPQPGIAKPAIAAGISPLLQNASGPLLAKGYRLAELNQIAIPPAAYLSALKDKGADAKVRQQAMTTLLGSDLRPQAIDLALKHGDLPLKRLALTALADNDPNRTIAEITTIMNGKDLPLKQHAVRTLAVVKSPAAATKLAALAKGLADGTTAPALQLDVYEAAKAAGGEAATLAAAYDAKLTTATPSEKLAFARMGGDAKNGENLFFNHAAAQCMRCHKIGRNGGDVGPNLSKVGNQFKPEYLLRSLVEPNAEIAKGYGVVTVTTKAGKTITGTLVNETPRELTVKVDKQVNKIAIADVAARTEPTSGMPPMGLLLKPTEVRDLVAYLASRK